MFKEKIKNIFLSLREKIRRFHLKEKNFIYNIYLSFACIFCFFFPDYILKLFGMSYVKIEPTFILMFFLFSLFLSLCKNRIFVIGMIVFFFILESIQLHYMAYFGVPITSPEIKKILFERNDIAESGFAYFRNVWYVLPSMLFSYGIYIYLFLRLSKKSYNTRLAYLVIIIFLLVKPDRAHRKTLKAFLPGPTRNSIHNTINTFSYFFVKDIWIKSESLDIKFKEYKVEEIKDKNVPDVLIFLVIESGTYNHMSLYGYERPTTPNLDKLQDEANFLYRKGVSASVSTASSLPLLFNVVREPGNVDMIKNSKSNLFNLAKQSGYYINFFTSQESKTLNDIGIKYIDHLITKDNSKTSFMINGDDELIKLIEKSINAKGKQFIGVMQRNLHSPYEKNYKGREEFAVYDENVIERKEKTINSYDNAMLYEDYLLSSLITYIKNSNRSIVLIITADHGQLLGENNLFGHNILEFGTAKVPFMVYTHNYKLNFDNISENISHYEIGKFAAKIIGFDINNLNDDGVYFIQGNDIYSDNFIIPFVRKGDYIELKKLNTVKDYYK